MKIRISFIVIVFTTMLFGIKSEAQISIKSEYISSSKYKDFDNLNTNGKGSAKIVRGKILLPLSVKKDSIIIKLDTIIKEKIWAVQVDGSFTQFSNKNIDQYSFPSDVINSSITLINIRTLNKNWTLLTALGIGVYSRPDDIDFNKVLGNGAVVFIRKITPNFKLGAGISLDSKFGFPMAYPAIFVEWNIDGKYYLKADMYEVKAGVQVNNYFDLSALYQIDGSLVLEKETMFTHQYSVVGIVPEFKIGKLFTIPITLGATVERSAFSHDRNVKDFFSYLSREDRSHFKPSFYASVAFKYGF